MAIVQKCGAYVARTSEAYGMGLVRNTSFWNKKIAVTKSNNTMDFSDDDDSVAVTPPTRHCYLEIFRCGEKSALEELPPEILIRILCCVEHDDLKRLFFVSRAMRRATLIAKQVHFAYTTPKKTIGFQNVDSININYPNNDDVEVPNAPKQSRVPRHRLRTKDLSDITVALFASNDNEVRFSPAACI